MLMKDFNIALARAGDKTETRRPLKPGERVRRGTWYTPKGYTKHHEGANRALYPERGKPQVARIEIIKLWQHALQDMTVTDMRNEGIQELRDRNGMRDRSLVIKSWIALWDSINTKTGTRWVDNPQVVAIRFKWLGDV